MMKLLYTLPLLIIHNLSFAEGTTKGLSVELPSKVIAKPKPTHTIRNLSKPQPKGSESTISQKTKEHIARFPSIQDISAIQKEKFQIKIQDCIAENQDLVQLIQIPSVQSYLSLTYTISSTCKEIKKDLQNALQIQQKMYNLSKSDICNISANDKVTMTIKIAKQNKKNVENKIQGISQNYTKYFTYNQEMANLELCLNYYKHFTTSNNIDANIASIVNDIAAQRDIVKKHYLKGIYGEDVGLAGMGIIKAIKDIENKQVSISQIKHYAIIEMYPNKWEMVGAMGSVLIYSDGLKFISIPFIHGTTYSCDKLPHNLFTIQKKIEIPKKDYSIYSLKYLK